MKVYVAYNAFGDLLAHSPDIDELIDALEDAGYRVGVDCIIGSCTP